jgi:hypothetical protein
MSNPLSSTSSTHTSRVLIAKLLSGETVIGREDPPGTDDPGLTKAIGIGLGKPGPQGQPVMMGDLFAPFTKGHVEVKPVAIAFYMEASGELVQAYMQATTGIAIPNPDQIQDLTMERLDASRKEVRRILKGEK